MTNSYKGFVVAPIIIWAVVGLFTVAAVNQTGLVQLNLSGEGGLLKVKNLTENKQSSPSPAPVTESDLLSLVKEFYSAISSKKFDSAWNLLSKDFQDYVQGYDNFVKGYETTLSVVVKDIHVQALSNNTVYVQIEAKDDINGQVISQTFSGIWELIKEDGGWKLNTANITANNPTPPVSKPLIKPQLNNSGDISSNQQVAIDEIQAKKLKISQKILLNVGRIRQLIGDDVVDNPHIVKEDPIKYGLRCDDFCIAETEMLTKQNDALEAEYNRLEELRLQILGQR